MSQTVIAPAPDCMILEPYAPPPSQAASTRDPPTTSVLCGRNSEQNTRTEPSTIHIIRKEKTDFGTPRSETMDPKRQAIPWKRSPLPNMRRVLTWLQDHKIAFPKGGSSAVNGPASHSKDGAASKKHCTPSVDFGYLAVDRIDLRRYIT